MDLVAIDPGTTQSAFVILETESNIIRAFDKIDNSKLADLLCSGFIGVAAPQHLVIEMIKSYGNVMGDSVLRTCVWIGKFEQAWRFRCDELARKTIVGVLCHNARAKDKNVRQALIDRFPARGGGKIPQIGNKFNPGPLYGITGDIWSALAVAVAWCDINRSFKC